jgi:hypothetical protein
MIRLVQLVNAGDRRVAVVEEPRLRLVAEFRSVYALVNSALESKQPLSKLIEMRRTDELLDYDPIYNGQSPWKLICPFDHPDEPARCLVSGTGLTHLGSARQRQDMHLGKADQALTDSMRMFRWGVEGGKPSSGQIGIAPEWFYKGTARVLRAHNQPLDIPSYAEDGGEEAEIAGVYLIGPQGQPYRVGMAIGNEFSDHRFEKKNYLNLAGSKLRTCGLGPELVIDPSFQTVPGKVEIFRGDKTVWSREICTGEAEMCHSLANIEHHHFKFESHRRPGDVHVHYFGADSLSFGDGIDLVHGDVMQIAFQGFGRPLRNVLNEFAAPDALVPVLPLI